MRRNQEGTVIIFVVVIIAIVGLLYSSIFILLGIENRISQSLINRTKAYYLAESGVERGMALLKQDITTSFVCDNPFSAQYKETHKIDVTIAQVETNIYKITSTGIYGQTQTKRTVEATVLKTEDTFQLQSRKEIN